MFKDKSAQNSINTTMVILCFTIFAIPLYIEDTNKTETVADYICLNRIDRFSEIQRGSVYCLGKGRPINYRTVVMLLLFKTSS